MSTAFSHFIRSLDADSFRRSMLGLLLVAGLLAAWFAWLFLARITVYEVTDTARLEVDRAVHPVDSPVAGRIVSTRLVMGREVQAGDVLVELDADTQQLQLKEEQTELTALAPQIATLRDEIAIEQQAIAEAGQAGRAGLDEARARFQEADASARFAEEQAKRLAGLHTEGIIAELELLRAKSEAKSRQAAADSLQFTVTRLEREQQTQETERKVRIEKLVREVRRLEGQATTTSATIKRLEHEGEKRYIRAPVAGRLGEVANLRPGSVVREGDKLGAILPSGQLKAVANFPPPTALGRIRPGHPARLRLHGFPWTQYGSISATVTSVASEVRDGQIRVELAFLTDPASPIPLQHGLPGTVEVEVERVSPAALVLRAAKFLAKPAAGNSSSRSAD